MFKLKLRDFLKGLLLSVMTAVLTVVQNSVVAGEIKFDWGNIGAVALSTALAYLLKNFLTDDVKAATKALKSESDGVDEDPLIIIPVDTLPNTGVRGVWYFYNGEYYYWSNANTSYVNAGGDRPTKPPHNP